MSLQCEFCSPDPLQYSKLSAKTLDKKYFEAFNFYFAKPVNEILANISTSQVILFKDFVFYDDESNEYLKRYYRQEEIKPRVRALTDFYFSAYKSTRPNLCIVEVFKIMQKRSQKLDKLFMHKNVKDNKEKIEGENIILGNILKEEEIEDRARNDFILGIDQQANKISFEDEEHDIYNPEFSEKSINSPKNEKKPFTLGKIKARNTFRSKEPHHNYESLFFEIISRQKAALKASSQLSSAKIFKDYSANPSDISELKNLQEMLRSSTDKLKNINQKPTLSSQLTQDSTKRTPANTTNISNDKKPVNLPISHGKLLGQISLLCKKTGSLEKVFEMLKKIQKPCRRNATNNIGSLTDRLPVKNNLKEPNYSPKKIKKLNLELLEKKKISPEIKKSDEKRNKKKKNDNYNYNKNQRTTKIAFRSLNNQIYNSLRNKSFTNGSSKSHLETQRSEDRILKAFKKTDREIKKKGILPVKLKKIKNNQILKGKNLHNNENDEVESSYGFWTSRSNRIQEEFKKIDREDYYGTLGKAKTDRFYKEKIVKQQTKYFK